MALRRLRGEAGPSAPKRLEERAPSAGPWVLEPFLTLVPIRQMPMSSSPAFAPAADPAPAPADPFAVETLVPGFQPPPRPLSRDAATMDAADVAARHWRSPVKGKLKPGSDTHALAMRAMFRETFNPYRPAVIAWPKLSDAARNRITSLPIWDIAVQTEGRARLFMAAYAGTLKDPRCGTPWR